MTLFPASVRTPTPRFPAVRSQLLTRLKTPEVFLGIPAWDATPPSVFLLTNSSRLSQLY